MSPMQQVLLLSFSVLFVCDGHCSTANKLKIKILYESLCPDSFNFITKQLLPVWDKIDKYVDVTFVPFGKASSLEMGTKFICQHGAAECKGNRIMSCALNEMKNQKMKVNYVACFMDVYDLSGRFDSNEYGQECARDIDFNKVMNCYKTKQGTTLQLQAERLTKKFGPQPNYIPTIIYNEVFDQVLQDRSLKNLYDTVCYMLNQTHPDAC